MLGIFLCGIAVGMIVAVLIYLIIDYITKPGTYPFPSLYLKMKEKEKNFKKKVK